jgi:hypothetical protein
MALKNFWVIYDRENAGPSYNGVTVTKAEAEKLHVKLGSTETNAVVIPAQEVQAGKIVKLEAESAEGAAIAARLLLGGSRSIKPLIAEAANLVATAQD